MDPDQLYELTQVEIPSALDDLGEQDLAIKFRGLKQIATPGRAQFAHIVFLGVLARMQRLRCDVGQPIDTGHVESLLVAAIEGLRGISGESACLN